MKKNLVLKPKPKKKVSYDKVLLNLWAEAVKVRAGYKCEYCGSLKNLNSHHIFSKRHRGTRWDIENGICLCSGCHFLKTFSAHQSPAFIDWLKGYIGLERYERIKTNAYSVKKWTEEEIDELIDDLENYIKEVI
jgi:hypothetical protein